MRKVVKRDATGDFEGKLREVLFVQLINRDSLSRSVPQEMMIIIDFYVSHLCGTIYALFERSLSKDEMYMNELTSVMQSIIKDIEDIKMSFYEKEKDE